jgi:large-conductance mechanosensitive channel
MKIRRLTIPAVLAAIVVLFGFMSPAGADPFNSVVQGLKSQRFYVSQDAGANLSASDRQAVISSLREDDSTIRMAIVKTERVNSDGLTKLDRALGRKGTLILLDGQGSRVIAGSHDGLGSSKISDLVAQARGQSSNLKELLLNLNQQVNKAVKDKKSSGAVGAFVVLFVLILIVAGVIFAIVFASRRRKRRLEQEMAELKQSVYEDVTRLGEDISALNLDVRDPRLDPAARDDYQRAMDSYDQAKAAVDQAQRPEDMRRVTTALEDGRYYMTAVRARVEGRPVPERRAPCFFNPQHGPSVQDVSWAPPGGAPRSVPACAADAQRVLSGQDPDARLVSVGGYRRPYWDAGPMYAPYAGGYYSGFGGTEMLGGILIGTALGSMFGGGFGGGWGGGGYDAGYDAGSDNNDSGGDSGFDIGGGDFGGFDGGDFGGGDFGGGDW